MKIKVFLVMGFTLAMSLAPIFVYAYDTLTPINTENDYFSKYEEDISIWCDENPARYEKEIEEVENKEHHNLYPTIQLREGRILELKNLIADAKVRCNTLLESARLPSTTQLSCGEGYVVLGGQCISHTENCIYHFGQNISGDKAVSRYLSSCTCNEGYIFDGDSCKLPEVESKPTIQTVIEKVYVPRPSVQEITDVQYTEAEVIATTSTTVVNTTPADEPLHSVESGLSPTENISKIIRVWHWFKHFWF